MDELNIRFKEMRKSLGKSQKEIGDAIGLSNSGISNIESGLRSVTERHIKLLEAAFNINEHWFRTGEGSMIKEPSNAVDTLHELIRTFDIEQLELMKECLDMIIKEKESDKGSILNFQRTVTRPVYDLPASAGTGQFLDGYSYTNMEFPESVVPLNSTFGVRIAGDSMEPEYFDQDIVFVRQQPVLTDGDIGIFVLNGEGYLKQFEIMDDGYSLISLNNKYPDMRITEGCDFRIVGKVLGKWSGK
ncbi:LexA repressor [Eubacterium maltosivorans]|nr:S24 family peptidase [Eubacterium maltosivorans]WPK81999.1 LexA repressor [Eubacterium maltosivorans]